MREIKFRGKRVDTGEWVYGIYVDVSAIKSNWHFIENTDGGNRNRWGVLPETVGQFICHDEDRDFWEGDIIEWTYGQDDNKPKRMILEFLKGDDSQGFNIPLDFLPMVIGNIHDNPELLTGGKK